MWLRAGLRNWQIKNVCRIICEQMVPCVLYWSFSTTYVVTVNVQFVLKHLLKLNLPFLIVLFTLCLLATSCTERYLYTTTEWHILSNVRACDLPEPVGLLLSVNRKQHYLWSVYDIFKITSFHHLPPVLLLLQAYLMYTDGSNMPPCCERCLYHVTDMPGCFPPTDPPSPLLTLLLHGLGGQYYFRQWSL